MPVITVSKTGSKQAEQSAKTKISFHRSYRRFVMDEGLIPTSGITFVMLCLTLSFGYLQMPWFSKIVSLLLQDFLGEAIGPSQLFVVPFPGSEGLFMLDINIALPSRYAGGGAIIVCFIIFILFDLLRLPKPLIVLVKIFALLTFFFAFLFWYFPGAFSHNSIFVEEFFIQVSAIIWCTLPFIFWISTLPLPSGLLRKALSLLFFELCLTCLFVLKYALFLVVCAKGTYLVLPLVMFFLTSLFDVMYMICFFSFMLSFTSRQVARDTKVWRWA